MLKYVKNETVASKPLVYSLSNFAAYSQLFTAFQTPLPASVKLPATTKSF